MSKDLGRRGAIWNKVLRNIKENDNGCWIWQGGDSGDGRGGGYARMCLDGQTVAVHRVMYCHAHGYIPGKKQIDHTCNNRMCVNPDHLELVTHKQNQKRKKKRG